MNKNEFLDQLFAHLTEVSDIEKEQINEYYTELLLDKMEEGCSEEEAVQSFGTPEEAAEMILEDLKESRMEVAAVTREVVRTQPKNDVLIDEPGITSFDIDVENASIKVYPSSNLSFRVKYIRDENVEVEYSRQGDRFVLRAREKAQRMSWRRFVCGPNSESKLVVEIPEGTIQQFRLKSSNAAVKINDIVIRKVGDVETSNGKIVLIGCSGGEFVGQSNNAKIHVENCDMKKIDVRTTNGTVSVENSKQEQLICKTTNGRVCVENIVADDITLRSTNGSIAGEIVGAQNDYNIDAHTINGSCRPSKQININSTKKLSARTTNGSVNISFTE